MSVQEIAVHSGYVLGVRVEYAELPQLPQLILFEQPNRIFKISAEDAKLAIDAHTGEKKIEIVETLTSSASGFLSGCFVRLAPRVTVLGYGPVAGMNMVTHHLNLNGDNGGSWLVEPAWLRAAAEYWLKGNEIEVFVVPNDPHPKLRRRKS